MKIVLLVVGKTVESHFIQGIEEYSKRLAHYVPFEIAVIPELRNTKSLSTDQQKEREADFILKSFLPGDYIVLLDEHGKEFTSTQFATLFGKENVKRCQTLDICHWRPLWFFPTHIQCSTRKNFSFKDDLFSPDDSPHLHRTTLSGYDYSQ